MTGEAKIQFFFYLDIISIKHLSGRGVRALGDLDARVLLRGWFPHLVE